MSKSRKTRRTGNTNSKSQSDLILQYFKSRPKQDIQHAQVVDWAVAEWKRQTGNVLRDPDRAIRKLHQEGVLIKIAKGVYKYDPDKIRSPKLKEFTQAQKRIILKRDNFRCVICGKGEKEGEELQVDHIKPQVKGGRALVDNGQALCGTHHGLKKTYDQTESGKRMFIRLHQTAVKSKDQDLVSFCEDVLKIYDQHDINGHIEWDKSQKS